jgi:hypothetical protein
MRSKAFLTAAVLSACAGTTLAQPVVDGTLVGDESFYGNILWVQNVPTGFGDNMGGDPCDPEDVGDPGAVKTGVEIAIPLSAIGNPGGQIRICAFINGGGHDYMSNQVLGGLAPDTGNLAEPRNVDFGNYTGTQHVAFTPQVVANAPVVDGTVDGVYGSALALQTNRTGFGDSSNGSVDFANGSELDGFYAVVHGGILYMVVAGNVESNFNKFDLFFDTVGGGQNRLGGTNPDVDFNGLNRMGDDGSGNGLTFDGNFAPDYYMGFGGGNDPYQVFANYAEVKEGGIGRYLGMGGAVTDGTLSGGDNPDGIRLTINNSNTAGVPGNCPPPPSEDVASGSELDGLYGYVDVANNRLYLLLTGNLQNGTGGNGSNSGNKINLFFDVQPGGQNRLRGDNVDISYGTLNRHGDDGSGNGLTFEDDFAADHWGSIKTNDNPVWQLYDSAVLRTNGPLEDFSGNHLDYGAYDGNPKADAAPIPYDGPRVDIQDGFTPNLFCNYGPRTTQLNPNSPVAGLILMFLNNSNTGGVTDVDASGAADVKTGVELSVDLDELGWDGVSEIKVAGFITSEDAGFMSNQFIGGLPDGWGNLGEPRVIDFGNIAGTQHVVIPLSGECYADCDGDGDLTLFDFLCFVNDFNTQGAYSNCDGEDGHTLFDFLCYVNAFNGGC